jgi:hypothetical protein
MGKAGSGQSRPKRHHYVPRWHLRRFALDPRRPRVARYSKSADEQLVLPIGDAAVIGNYYTWYRDDETDSTVEYGLALLDGRASEVLPKLERGEVLTEPERNVVAGYVAMMRGRVPPMRDGYQKMIETCGALQAEMAIANATPKQRRAWRKDARRRGLARNKGEYAAWEERILDQLRSGEMKVTTDHIVTMGLAAHTAERSIPILESMSWMVIEAPPGAEFVISDNPVAFHSESTPPYMGAGLLTRDIEITMPLSRHHLLLLSREHWYKGCCCVVGDAVDHFNSRTWLAAQDYVFATSSDVLDRTAALLEPDVRRRPGGGIEISGGLADGQ